MKKLIILTAMFLALGIWMVLPTTSYADWHGGHRDHYYHGGHDHVNLSLGFYPDNYYYDSSYVYVSPPVVETPYYQLVSVNGSTYYVNNGTYYVYNGYAYQPVPPPVTYVQQPTQVITTPVATQPQQVSPTITASSASTEAENEFTVNIPNSNGGYTSVTIRKSGKGFVGPQNEFYAQFPKVSQLKAMYAN